MKDRISTSAIISCSLAICVLVLTTSCSKLDDIQQQAGKTQDELNKAQERLNRIETKLDQTGTGRFQIVVANQGDRGTVLFLIDTVRGDTSIYRPPIAGMINGFWSNIPKITYSDEYWQKAITQGQPPAPAATPSTPGTPQK
jgi:tetrahydromethanopterin S-methyltransferase subunit G